MMKADDYLIFSPSPSSPSSGSSGVSWDDVDDEKLAQDESLLQATTASLSDKIVSDEITLLTGLDIVAVGNLPLPPDGTKIGPKIAARKAGGKGETTKGLGAMVYLLLAPKTQYDVF